MTKYSNYKDNIRRQNLKQKQINIIILKSFLKNEYNSKSYKFKIMLKMNQLYQETLGNKIKNRCIFSTKIRSVSRLTNMTKASFKENINWGQLNGFRKSSW